MKAILLCPSERPALAFLSESTPLVTLPVFGESLLSYWLDHLASKVKEVRVIATDRPEMIRAMVEDGARWGLKVEILAEMRELKVSEARARYRPKYESDWLAEPDDVHMLDHFPGVDEGNIFGSYADYYAALVKWMPQVTKSPRIGLREVRPGVWIGRRTQIAPTAELRAPCWLGENVQVGPNAVIGPGTILESQVVVESACEIEQSWVGPETFVGSLTKVKDSLAWGNTLINWRNNSCIHVPDAFLLSSLAENQSGNQFQATRGRLSSFVQSTLSRPKDVLNAIRKKICGSA